MTKYSHRHSSGPTGRPLGLNPAQQATPVYVERGHRREPKARDRFVDLGNFRRVWTISAVQGEVKQLRAIHQAIDARIDWGDKVLYLGNMVGVGSAVAETIEEVLAFRRHTLSRFGFLAGDVMYLRGQQEEMWDKLLQIQFAQDPVGILTWMLDHGLGPTLDAFGSSGPEALSFARQGVVELTNWTTRLRGTMRSHPGYIPLWGALRRAAITSPQTEGSRKFMFVHAGIDPALPLTSQVDSFWWHAHELPNLIAPYEGYRRIFSGWTPKHEGVCVHPFATTLDAGCGLGGPLIASCIDVRGEFVELIEA